MIKILIVEDDFAVRDTLKDFIEFMYDDVEVVEASNGKTANEFIDQDRYDILITDQMMPDIQGSDLINRNIDKLEKEGTWVYVYSGQMESELKEKLAPFKNVKVIDKFTNPMFFKEIIDAYKAEKA
ncbi:response regulator [Roseivirga sp.]|uniref:response regulator n=1 Tax=Roseivirga sp. TaxID=1964215 RepID=UPI003B8C570D